MSPDEFRRISILIVGDTRGWQRRIARKVGKTPSSVSRYATGDLVVPPTVSVALEALLKRDPVHQPD